MSDISDYYLTPLKPYENKQDYIALYDNMPFEWDPDNERQLTLESGNVIKGYRCKIMEPYEIKH